MGITSVGRRSYPDLPKCPAANNRTSSTRRSSRRPCSRIMVPYSCTCVGPSTTPSTMFSAAELITAKNIVDGVVEGPTQVQEYGTMIREQGRRLERLVDEVLLFAAGRFGRSGYDLRPTEVVPILEQSLAGSEAILRDAGFTFQKEIGAQLPFVIADSEALSKCVENLISNAMKYSGDNRWVFLRALCTPNGGSPEVQITVEDKGIGISPADLPHIFDPFYRAEGVRDGQVRGVGLGLYLVKRMLEAMGGWVSVSSKHSKGSVFTLLFPVFESQDLQNISSNADIAQC